MKKIGLALLIISISLVCLLLAIERNTFKVNHYSQNYHRHGIERLTNKDQQELMDITQDLLLYLKGKAGKEILQPNFNEREVLHMEDVKVLYSIAFALKYILLALCLAILVYLRARKEVNYAVGFIYKALFVNWIFIGILGIMVVFDFNKYFTYFHHIFFTNDLWLLDPRTDLLIQMLPEEFFYSMARSIGVSFLQYVAIIQLIAFAIWKKGKDKYEGLNQ